MTKEYFQVPAEDIHNNWQLFASLIENAKIKANQEDLSFDFCYFQLMNNYWQLFVIIENEELQFITVTNVTPVAETFYLTPIFISVMDGKKLDLEFLSKTLEEIARNFNCSKIIGGGRKGWGKLLSKLGYEPVYMFEKKL